MLSKLLNFLPKLRPGALATNQVAYKKMCIQNLNIKNEVFLYKKLCETSCSKKKRKFSNEDYKILVIKTADM